MLGWWNGIHDGLRSRCRKACRFKSCPEHHTQSGPQWHVRSGAQIQVPGLVHERMFEGCGIGIEGAGPDTEFPAGLAPSGDRGEHLEENGIGLGKTEIEARRGSERRADGRTFLILRDGSLWHLRSVDFR